MLIVRMPRGNAQAAVPWPSWSSYSFQLPFVVGETGVAMEAIHRVAPHADWVVVPDSLAGLHPQHQVVRIDHVAAGAPVDAPILGSSWLVGRSWITSWLAAAAWCAADSGVRRLAVARLRAPLAVLQRTAERLVALGLLEQAYSGDPELWRKVRELSGGGGQDPELEWGSSTTGPQFEEGEVLVTNDMRAAGMESLSVQDVIGDETSLRKLGLLLRLWGPYEARRLREPENVLGAFHDCCLGLVGRDNLSNVRSAAAMRAALRRACETTLPTEELWPAKWAGLVEASRPTLWPTGGLG